MDKPLAAWGLIKTDGSLWIGPDALKTDLLKLGWREVHNPKRTYYPEMDKTHPSYRNEIILQEEETNLLELEEV